MGLLMIIVDLQEVFPSRVLVNVFFVSRETAD